MTLIQTNSNNNSIMDYSLVTSTSSEANIISSSWYQPLNNHNHQELCTQVESTFKDFYDKSIVNSIKSSARIFNYFDQVKMTQAGAEQKCLATKKIFSINKKYDDFILSKKRMHSTLNKQLAIIKNRLISIAPTIRRKLKNNDFKDFPNIDKEISDCTMTMNECRQLTAMLLEDKDNSSFTAEEESILGSLLLLNNLKLDLSINDGPLADLTKQIAFKTAEFNQVAEKKLKNEFDIEYNNNKIKYINEQIISNDALIQHYEVNCLSFQQNINASEQRKKMILEEFNDPKRLATFLNENLERRKKFDENFASTMLESQKTDQDLIYDIKNLKTINKNYHIIFLLDKSGSMYGQFDEVIKSTQTVIQKRASLPITSDTVSIIKFNDKAVAEVQNVSVKEPITIKNDVGGGTSFVEPLDKLQEILNEVNFEITTPLVFFLSDGFGESKQTVYNKCTEVKNSIGSADIIFFSVGFGADADSECLDQMCKIFNNGTSTLKIGNDMCPLYNNAQNESELTRVFTLFEKLFNYQQNLLKTKQDLLQGVYQEKKKQYETNRESLNELDKQSIKFMDEQKEYATKSAYSQDEIIAKYNQSIEENKRFIQNLKQTNDELKLEILQCQTRLSNLEPLRIIAKDEYEKAKKELKELNKKYDDLQKSKNDQIEQHMNELEELTNSDTYLNDLKKDGVSIDLANPTEFKFIFRNFSKDYYKFQNMLQEKVLSSDKVDDEYEKVISKLTDLNNSIQELKNIAETENLDLKIWELVVAYYKNSNLINRDEANDKENLSNILFLKADFNERKQEALEVILNSDTVSGIFTRCGKPNFVDDFIRNLSNLILNKIGDLKRNLITGDQSDVNQIKLISDRLNKAEDERYEFSAKEQDIKYILNAILQIRNEVKEKFIQNTIGRELETCLSEIIGNYFPSIDVLNSKFNILSIKN